MNKKISRCDRNWKPSDNDDNCYVYHNGYWEIYDDYEEELTADEEDAIEAAYFRSQKRKEWDYYHPGEPCPKCELE